MTADETDPMLPLIFTHTYDEVEINSAVPWDELSEATQELAKKVVDYYRMKASINMDAQIDIYSLNIESDDDEIGMLFSLVATVEPLGDNIIDYQELFNDDDDE